MPIVGQCGCINKSQQTDFSKGRLQNIPYIFVWNTAERSWRQFVVRSTREWDEMKWRARVRTVLQSTAHDTYMGGGGGHCNKVVLKVWQWFYLHRCFEGSLKKTTILRSFCSFGSGTDRFMNGSNLIDICTERIGENKRRVKISEIMMRITNESMVMQQWNENI